MGSPAEAGVDTRSLRPSAHRGLGRDQSTSLINTSVWRLQVEIWFVSARMKNAARFRPLQGSCGMLIQATTKAAVRTSSVALFARNFFKYPSMLGSVVPSSPFLVKDLMAQIDWERARILVEFGPGVGTITREALKRMRADAVLVVIELNQEFVDYLSNNIRDPRLRVVQGSAAHVRRILNEQGLHPRTTSFPAFLTVCCRSHRDVRS